jgi:hypothetical protein
MIGTVQEGTRSDAIDMMVAEGALAVHDSFDPGEYFEFDAGRQLFVGDDGSDVTEIFFTRNEFLSGWHQWGEEDTIREDDYCKKIEMEARIEEEEEKRRLDANIGGYSFGEFSIDVLETDSHIYYRKSSNGGVGRGLIKGFRVTADSMSEHGGSVSIEYNVKYDNTGCTEWLPGADIFASKLDLAASIVESV